MTMKFYHSLILTIFLFLHNVCSNENDVKSEKGDAITTAAAPTATATTISPLAPASARVALEKELLEYGVDVSWPMHHTELRLHKSMPDRSAVYQEYMNGCSTKYSTQVCHRNERDRIAMNLIQPAWQTNFTYAGFAKIKMPDELVSLVQSCWTQGQEQLLMNSYDYVDEEQEEVVVEVLVEPEDWEEGNIHVNHWHGSGTGVVPLQARDRHAIVTKVQGILEHWVNVPLVPTSVYGIRVYPRGSILAPHVDRLPLVISAILNVAQKEMDEPWPLEVIGHDGVARNITMEPGEMILYESHSVIHGRPFPLQGDHYANIFVHFEPIGYSAALSRKMQVEEQPGVTTTTLKERFTNALHRMINKEPASKKERPAPSLPPYIDEGTEEAEQWRQEFVFYKDPAKPKKYEKSAPTGVTNAHNSAAIGDLKGLMEAAAQDPDSLSASDSNGWKPIHEAARAGHTEIIAYLIQKGVDLNPRTNDGEGGTPLWWAEHMNHEDHPVIQLLRRHGGVAIGPI